MPSSEKNIRTDCPAKARMTTRRNMLRLGFTGAAVSLGLSPLKAMSLDLSAPKTVSGPMARMIEKANFGADYAVLDAYRKGPYAFVRLGFQGHSFVLKSADGRKWRTT